MTAQLCLPNGWRLSPAGTHLGVGELPLNADLSPDGRYAIITNDGTSQHSISIVDLDRWEVTQTLRIPKAWMGIKFFDGGKKFVASGGNDNCLRIYRFEDGMATEEDSVSVGRPWPKDKIWLAGLDIDHSTSTLFVAGKEDSRLYVIDLARKACGENHSLACHPVRRVV